MGRNLRKMAEDEFENFGGASTLGDLRVVDAVDTFHRWVHQTGYNILEADKTPASLRRKRLRACIEPKFLTKLFAA